MANPILVTGTAGRVGRIVRTVTELRLKQGKTVRAMVRNEDERAHALRDMGGEVVTGDLLDLDSMHRVITGCERVYLGMSVSDTYLGEKQGIPWDVFKTGRKPISEAHNRQETPLFAKRLQQTTPANLPVATPTTRTPPRRPGRVDLQPSGARPDINFDINGPARHNSTPTVANGKL
jgi:NmrA-like family